MSSYLYYQLVGGNEHWSAIQADRVAELEALKPTFVTILNLDTLIPDEPSRELLEKTKYQGPMYFDLDSDEISESIADAKVLLEALQKDDITDTDIDIFLSGKKGLHLLIPQAVFMEKPVPMLRLPAIYKSWAFKLAVDTMDMAVYTARRGRMLRTPYNIRENGNYKVPITAQELRELTPERYQELCKAPRRVPKSSPTFRWKAAIAFSGAADAMPKTVHKRSGPPDHAALARHWVEVEDLFRGENVASGAGFNKIAIQLCLYAREADWTIEKLLEKAEGLIQRHNSDGDRYNTPRKRIQEMRRMFGYVEDNPAYDYSLGGLRSMMVKPVEPELPEGSEPVASLLSVGVQQRGNAYVAIKGEDSETQISNFVFEGTTKVVDIVEGIIVAITTTLKGVTRMPISLSPLNFTSSSGLQNAIAPYGASFTGTDLQARGIYQIMLKELSFNKFLISTEGVTIVTATANVHPELAGKDIIVWADRNGVQMPDYTKQYKLDLVFQGHPDPLGVLRSDLTQTPAMSAYMENGGQQAVKLCLQSLFACHPPETIGKILGWMVACHWKALFQKTYSKFPLLHVYGPAGAGKSELTMSLLRLFYYNEEPKSLTPSGTAFSFSTMIAGSASIPVILDEYKPHTMKEKLEPYRAILRDSYNAKTVSRGGGSRTRDSFNALSTVALSGPVGFIAEAVETETALMERSLLVAIKRATPKAAAEGLQNFLLFAQNLVPLSVIGKQLAGWIVSEWSIPKLRKEFDAMHQWAIGKYMVQPGDAEKMEKGELTREAYEQKLMGRPRPIYNSTVALFGIIQLRKMLLMLFPATFEEDFAKQLKAMTNAVYENMDVVSRTSMPEYLKVLQTMTDLAKMKEESNFKVLENIDYNIVDLAGKQVLAIHPRSVYNKYRIYMKMLGANPLYPTDASFEIAMGEVSQFLGFGEGTKALAGRTILLDLEGLIRAGMPEIPGRIVVLD